MYSPLELQQIEFEKKAFGGYDTESVDEIFSALTGDYNTLYVENADLKKKVRELEAKLSESEGLKGTLDKILITAQETGDTMKANAEKEAALTIEKAKQEAASILDAARNEVGALEEKKTALKNEVDVFVTKMGALFKAQVDYLNKAAE